MKKYFLVMLAAVFLLGIAAAALAFSVSLATLHVSSLSLANVTAAPASAAPMTYGDESYVTPSSAGQVRIEQAQTSKRVCLRDKTDSSRGGF